MKKILSVFICAVMVISLVPALTAGAASGTCGDNLTWILEDGTLTINGTGKMWNWPSSSVPWSAVVRTITAVNISNGVTSIGIRAFYRCTNLASITMGNSVTSIGASAFNGCINLTSVTIPDSVTSIGGGAFADCTYLASITIPNSVTSIGDSAFSDCTSLTSVTIGNSVTSIGGSAFSGCNSLTSITIPDNVTSIDNSAFSNCTSLTSVSIGNGVTSIGNYAFEDCSGLTSVTIGSGVTSIGGSAFSGCSSLTSITIPDSVTSIGSYAFSGCSSLTSVIIPDSVTGIGEYAFSGCSSLTSVIIPDSVTGIGKYAFSGCDGLTSMTIPDGVTRIERNTFEGCAGLTSITIPDGVTRIERNAFEGCTSLTSITIPDNVTYVGESAFINTAYYNNEENWENGVLYIGNYLIEAKHYVLGEYNVKDGTICIAEYAFNTCYAITSVILPDTVKRICESAFYGCTGLKSITIGIGLSSIALYAFNSCSNLTDVYYAGSETEWSNIYYVKNYNKYLYSATKHYNSAGPNEFVIGEDTYPFTHSASNFCKGDYNYSSGVYIPTNINEQAYPIEDKAYWAVLKSTLSSGDYRTVLRNSTKPFYEISTQNNNWGGSCQGMEMSMIAMQNGSIGAEDYAIFPAAVENAHDFKEADYPKNNSKLRDLINFYQLLQYTSLDEPTMKVYNENSFVNFLNGGASRQDFWDSFADAVEQAADNDPVSPLVMSYNMEYKGEIIGHAVIFYGVTETDEQYIFNVYDCNKVDIESTCTVNKTDYSFTTDFYYDPSDSWTKLDYYDEENVEYICKLASGVVSTAELQSTEEAYVTFEISSGTSFILENAEGQSLSYVGGEASSDMAVYDYTEVGNAESCISKFKIAQSDAYYISSITDNCEISIYSDDYFYSTEVSNADKIIVTSSGISIDGSSFTFNVWVGTENEDYELLCLSAAADGSVSVENSGDKVSYSSENELTDVSFYTCYENQKEIYSIENLNYIEISADVDAVSVECRLETQNGGSLLTVDFGETDKVYTVTLIPIFHTDGGDVIGDITRAATSGQVKITEAVNAASATLLVWDTLENMQPLCGAKEVTID